MRHLVNEADPWFGYRTGKVRTFDEQLILNRTKESRPVLNMQLFTDQFYDMTPATAMMLPEDSSIQPQSARMHEPWR